MKKNLTLIILNIAVSAIFIGLVFVPILVTVFVYPLYNNAWELVGFAHVTYRHSLMVTLTIPSIFLVAFLGLNLVYNAMTLLIKKFETMVWINLLTIALSIASFVWCFIASGLHVRVLVFLPYLSWLIP